MSVIMAFVDSERHLHPGTITFYRYHGSGRKIPLPQLLQFDVVITTYATIAAEFCRGQSILDRVEWYRLVLDEGSITTRIIRYYHC